MLPVDSSAALALAANAVAVCAVVMGWRQNRDNLLNQRRLADLGHVRGLLDDAAIALHSAAYVLDEVRSQDTQHTPSFFKSEKGRDVFADLERSGWELNVLLERLRLRFGGDHRVVECFGAADTALLDVFRAAGLTRIEPDADGSPAAAHAIQQLHDQIRKRLSTQRERFDTTRDDFIAAACAVAGAQLPTSD